MTEEELRNLIGAILWDFSLLDTENKTIEEGKYIDLIQSLYKDWKSPEGKT